MANSHDVFAIVNIFTPAFELWRLNEHGEAVWKRRPDCDSMWALSADDQLVLIRCRHLAEDEWMDRVVAYAADGTELWKHDEPAEAGSSPNDAGRASGVVRVLPGSVLLTSDTHAWLLDRKTGARRLIQPVTGHVDRFDSDKLEFRGDAEVSVLDPVASVASSFEVNWRAAVSGDSSIEFRDQTVVTRKLGHPHIEERVEAMPEEFGLSPQLYGYSTFGADRVLEVVVSDDRMRRCRLFLVSPKMKVIFVLDLGSADFMPEGQRWPRLLENGGAIPRFNIVDTGNGPLLMVDLTNGTFVPIARDNPKSTKVFRKDGRWFVWDPEAQRLRSFDATTGAVLGDVRVANAYIPEVGPENVTKDRVWIVGTNGLDKLALAALTLHLEVVDQARLTVSKSKPAN